MAQRLRLLHRATGSPDKVMSSSHNGLICGAKYEICSATGIHWEKTKAALILCLSREATPRVNIHVGGHAPSNRKGFFLTWESGEAEMTKALKWPAELERECEPCTNYARNVGTEHWLKMPCARTPARVPARAPARTPARAPARVPVRAPARTPVRTPANGAGPRREHESVHTAGAVSLSGLVEWGPTPRVKWCHVCLPVKYQILNTTLLTFPWLWALNWSLNGQFSSSAFALHWIIRMLWGSVCLSMYKFCPVLVHRWRELG